MLEGLCSLLLGIGLAFLYSWRMSLVCVGVSPFMLLGAILNFKIMEGFSDMNQQNFKEGELLASDAINNYRTVASFGHEDRIVSDYNEMLQGPVKKSIKKLHLVGVIFAFS